MQVASRLGDVLLKQGLLTQAQLNQAQQNATTQGLTIQTAIVRMGFIAENIMLNALGTQFSLPVVELDVNSLDKELVSLIPQEISIRHSVLPLALVGNNLTIAIADPSNVVAINDIRFITGNDIRLCIASESSIKALLDKAYEVEISFDDLISEAQGNGEVSVITTEEDVDLAALEKATEDAPVVKLVNAILTDAIKKGASDIHIEPYEKVFRVRFRIDGVLYDIMRPPLKLKNAMTSRLKIMANLDIAERRLPQDGRIKMRLANKKEMDYRVSVLPALFGEKVVLRLLDKGNLQTDMLKLGFDQSQLRHFMEGISKPYGLVLVTGPTGSGKTTTLYSAVAELNKIDVNISTAEDPVEFNFMGINQCQVNEDIGLSFAAALRSFLRQDPDIIMVGEIRDYETAEIAIKASLTGHLVLSTLHTNDAPATINRLLNMGVEPFLVASSINVIVAQRLARKICEGCKKELDPNPVALENVGMTPEEARTVKIFKGSGCTKCSGTGYKGRIALYEVLTMNETVKELVLNGVSSAEIKRGAIQAGMATLRRSGLNNIKNGITTIEEVLRVTAND